MKIPTLLRNRRRLLGKEPDPPPEPPSPWQDPDKACLQPQGKILLLRYQNVGGSFYPALARYSNGAFVEYPRGYVVLTTPHSFQPIDGI